METKIRDFIFNLNSRLHNTTFQKTLETLVSASNVQPKKTKKPTAYIIAGPNGSGKSVLISNLVKTEVFNERYVNTYMFAQTLFSDVADEMERNEKGQQEANRVIEQLVSENKSFVYETVFSHEYRIDYIKSLKEKGYRIVSVFVFTVNPEINIQRVNNRKLQGGHGIEEKKIRERYKNSLVYAEKLREMSDEFYEVNNSKEIPYEN